MIQELLNKRMEIFDIYLNKTNLSHQQYQKDGVRWILNNELREDPVCDIRGGFIADEMGLGKTIMMIGAMLCNSSTFGKGGAKSTASLTTFGKGSAELTAKFKSIFWKVLAPQRQSLRTFFKRWIKRWIKRYINIIHSIFIYGRKQVITSIRR